MAIKTKVQARMRRKKSIRKKLSGTKERPRISVFRSAKHIYAQVIDDDAGNTLLAVSTIEPSLRDEVKGLKKVEQAKKVGEFLAKKCLESKIDQIIFDRNGFIYHGRVQALAKGARDGGLKF